MTQPTIPVLEYSFLAEPELGGAVGSHLDSDFNELVESCTQIIAALALIQRDDGKVRNGAVTPDSLSSETLTLIAGSATQTDPDVDWRPRGTWATATLYSVGNIVEQTAFNWMCVIEHVSAASFNTDLAAGRWQQMTVLEALQSSDITGALGYTPVNKAGDTMTGALVIPTGSKILGASGMTWTDTLMASQDLATINKGLYSVYSTAVADIAYGFASNVYRSAGAFLTVGGQFSAYGSSGAGASVFGGNTNAVALNGFAQAMVCLELTLASFTPNNTSNKFGLDLVFADRAISGSGAGNYSYTFPFGTVSNAGGGLGNNRYNYRSRAVNISSQERSSTGEYCGFTRGVYFNEFSLDSENDASFPSSRAYPIGIDFSPIHYYGGSDPVTAYNMEAAIAFRDLQGIWWNRDPASAGSAAISKIRTHFNPFTLRWVLENTGVERFAVDVTNGNIYQNGVIFGGSGGAGLASNNTWTGTNTFNNTVTIGSNLTFSGNARRITGDFSNATIASRTIFQTSTLNAATELMAMPNGTSTASAFNAINTSGATLGAVIRMAIDATTATIQSAAFGGGTVIPLAVSVGASEAMRIDTSQRVLIATATSPTVSGVKLRVNGIVQIDNAVAFRATGSGGVQSVADSTFTTVTFATESYDQNANYNTGTSAFTPAAGKYRLSASTGIVNGGCVDQRRLAISIYKNGAAHADGTQMTCSGTGAVTAHVSTEVDANGTDAFTVVVWHNMGLATDFDKTANVSWFAGSRIG